MDILKILSEPQIKTLRLRHNGLTWKEISDALNFNHIQQAQENYSDSIKKLRRYVKIQKVCPELCAAFQKSSLKISSLTRLYNILVDYNLLDSYLTIDADDLVLFPQIGPKSIDLIIAAQDIYDKNEQESVHDT